VSDDLHAGCAQTIGHEAEQDFALVAIELTGAYLDQPMRIQGAVNFAQSRLAQTGGAKQHDRVKAVRLGA
jgi:hypothetical protein